MLQFAQVKGVIFDLDDTLLDNGPADNPAEWLHSRSRLAAVQEVARRHNNARLASLTAEENGRAFTTAKVHSIEGAVWNILQMKGIVKGDEVDYDHPLLKEITLRKIELHPAILREFGSEVPGAAAFVKRLAAHGLSDKLAIATSAVYGEIEIFLKKYGLSELFPAKRIISAEKVTSPKPDPESFNLAFTSLELPDSDRSSVLAFEDHPRGMLAAKGAGLHVCALLKLFKENDPVLLAAQPDVIAGSYAEFARVLGVPE